MKKAIYRRLINWYQVSDRELPKWLDAACEKDASLAQERRFGDELTHALQKRPNHQGSCEGPSMAARVLKQIAEEDYLAERAPDAASVWSSWIRPAGVAMAVCAFAFAAYQYLDTNSGLDDEVGTAIAVRENVATDALPEMPADWKNPLDQEIENIVSDAKGALGFFAATFVPSSYLNEDDQA